MKKIIKFFSQDWFFVLILSSFLLFLSFIPLWYQIKQTPPQNIFLGVHNNPLDYPMFISEIIQAQNNRWTFLAKFTSEPQIGTLVHPIYLPLGKITGIFDISPVSTYHLGRIIFGLAMSFSIYYFICQLFSSKEKAGFLAKRKLAFLLALFSAGFTVLDWSKFPPSALSSYLPWWTGGDVLRRAAFQPHAMLKNILLLLIITWMGKLLVKNQKKYLFYSLPAGVLLGLLDPMNTLTILIMLGIYLFFKYLFAVVIYFFTRKYQALDKKIIPSLVSYLLYALFALFALLYTNWVFNNTPWKAVKDWEAHQFYLVPFWDYVFHIGITFYLGALGIFLLIFRRRNIFSYYILFLSVIPILLISSGYTQKFGLSTLRFFQTPVYVFLAIASTETIAFLFSLLFRFISFLRLPPFLLSLSSFSVIFSVYFAVFLPSLPAYPYSLTQQINEYKTWYWNIYPDKKSYELMLWLKKNTSIEDVVLTNAFAGNILPAVSGNTVYIGHMVSTLNYEAKNIKVQNFLEGKMETKEAYQFLINSRINYLLLYWGENLRVESKNYPFIEKVYGNEAGFIYSFQR